MRCIQIDGSDNQMDCRVMFYDPLNPLPPKCEACGFPDLDFVPQPYFLVKSRAMTPNETAMAENGNFLVRDRVRRVLELLAPGQCRFYPTHFKGTMNETPWSLAVPVHQVVVANVNPSISRCQACGEPRSAHPGPQYSEWIWDFNSEYDMLKSSTWGSADSGWDKWTFRYCYLSVRLFHLLKQAGVKGLFETTGGKPTLLDEIEAKWIQESLASLKEQGIPLNAPGTVPKEDAQWFRVYLRQHESKIELNIDVKSLEQTLKVKLPKSYIEFITKVGPVTFSDIDNEEGFDARILLPQGSDSVSYRKGILFSEDEETKLIDGVMFADTGAGDCFCFDLQKSRKEFQVFIYKHDYGAFELYAENFAACIKRFATSEIEVTLGTVVQEQVYDNLIRTGD